MTDNKSTTTTRSQFNFRPNESLDEYNTRIDDYEQECKSFNTLLDAISELARQTHREPHTRGFFRAWLELMFAELDDDNRNRVLRRFTEYNSGLTLAKLSVSE